MGPEVWYANPSDCRGLLPDFPGYGRDGHFGDGRRASRQTVQREVERPAKTGEAIIHADSRSGATMWGALYRLQGPRKTVFTEAAVFDVDPFHRVGGGHGAAIVLAMGEA
jgi:hypothetical protein